MSVHHRQMTSTPCRLGALVLDPDSRAGWVPGTLGVSIPAVKKELECYISPGKPRRRRRGKASGPAC